MTIRVFTYYWYRCPVVKFSTALPTANGFDMFVTVIASNNDIRREPLNDIKADDLKRSADINDKVDGSLYVEIYVACVANAYLVAEWANLRPHLSGYKIPFDDAPSSTGVEDEDDASHHSVGTPYIGVDLVVTSFQEKHSLRVGLSV